jgi:sulfur-carrier protein
MRVQLKYFAAFREKLALSDETWESQARDVAQLREELIARGHPYDEVLGAGVVMRYAVNQELVEPTAELLEGCEVAFFPPVTGG